MHYSVRNCLFSGQDLSDILRAMTGGLQNRVDSIPKDQFLATPYDDLVEHFISLNTIAPLVIYEDQIVASEPMECKVDVSGDYRRAIRDKSKPFLIDGYEVRVELPFSGDGSLWHYKTNTYSTMLPIANISGARGDDFGLVIMRFRQPHDAKPQLIKKELDQNLNLIREYVSWSYTQVQTYNQTLPQIVKRAVDFRKERLMKSSGISDMLGIQRNIFRKR